MHHIKSILKLYLVHTYTILCVIYLALLVYIYSYMLHTYTRFGLSDLVTVTCQDVCARYDTEHPPGFRDIPQNYADAVFLGMYICIYRVLCNT